VVLPDFLKRFRNRLLTDPTFIAFAQRFPLTRPIARRKSLDLFHLLAGFSYSQVLYACVELRVFAHVGETVDTLAPRIGLSVDKTDTLVRAAVAIGLLDWEGAKIILGPQGAALVAQPWIMRFVEHHKYFYRDLEDPVAMLRGKFVDEGLRDYWRYDDPAKDRAEYSALMAASQEAVSAQILDAYDMGRHKAVLDVGGGSGAFLEAVGKRYPHMERYVFDMAGVTGNDDKITRKHGDFQQDPLPFGMDLITVVRVLHDHDDGDVLALLRNIRKACQVNTTLLVAEPFAGNPATAAVTDAYFNMYFAAMGQGRTRTPAKIAELAKQAGFQGMRMWPTDMPLITGVLSFSPDSSSVK
jgi:demethylspheroidene O-methyltransferase